MLLAVDIGNSNIVVGVSESKEWTYQWRIHTEADKTADEYAVLLRNLFEAAGLSFSEIGHVVISSVVPQLTGIIKKVCERETGISPLVLNAHTDTGISLGTHKPENVGADLIAGAAAAFHQFKERCIIVDFGTATTIMEVNETGMLRGGAICAGLKVTVDALVGKAAQLSQIPLEPPTNVIGKSTVEAMQSGLVLGHLCMVEGLINRMKNEAGPAKVIATGGFAEALAMHTDYFDVVDPMLTLNGLRIIMERQKRGGKRERD